MAVHLEFTHGLSGCAGATALFAAEDGVEFTPQPKIRLTSSTTTTRQCVEARTVLPVPVACTQRGPSGCATAARSSWCQCTATIQYFSYKNTYTS